MTPKLRVLLMTLLVTIPSDQLSKAWVSARLPIDGVYDPISVVDHFFYIVHVRNPGAAFGLLLDWSWEARLFVFIVIAAIAVAVILSFYHGLAPGDRYNSLALGLILGGALGNLIDRVVRGEVVDFLHFRLWGGYTWPDFNFADGFIVVGVTALMLELLASEGASRARSETSPDRDEDRGASRPTSEGED